MNRTTLDNGTWFDRDSCKEAWKDGTWWNGNNHISLATEWVRASLLKTAKGSYIVETRGQRTTYEVICAKEAAQWLIRNEMDLPDDLVDFIEADEV